jgi:hypothetical protein
MLAAGALAAFAIPALAQDGTMYPMEAPAEPDAIPLGTGGVKDQPAEESWFRQWGDPMARNIPEATLTPFLADPYTATGASGEYVGWGRTTKIPLFFNRYPVKSAQKQALEADTWSENLL